VGTTLFAVRPSERRNTGAAFFLLFGFVGSLSILETGRDALFLSRLPATRLPWMYIAVAAISLVIARLQSRFSRVADRVALSLWTLVAAGVTLALAWLARALGTLSIYTIYVWSSVLATLVLVPFWTLLASVFTVTQAKRLYGLIGVGGVLGAIAGSGVARQLAGSLSPQRLVLASGMGFALSAVLPFLFRSSIAPAAVADGPSLDSVADGARSFSRSVYARRLVLAVLIATACVTVADYVFKSTAARVVPRAELGSWLATVYLCLNIGSLFTQVVLTGWLTRRLSIPASFSILPLLLFGGGVAMMATGGIGAALLIKSADGCLRYSLHKTVTEMLFLPFSDDTRRRVKAFIDVVGQRGGQALASVLVLVLSAMAYPRAPTVVLLVLAAAWTGIAWSMRGPYLQLFRSRLTSPWLARDASFPDLDLASLETLMAALNSSRDQQVIAALDVLEREGRGRLIPALILHHPTEAVVERALAIFAEAKRTEMLPVIRRLTEHPSARVRAAAAAAQSVLDPDVRPLLMRMRFDDSPEVRATIAANLIASGAIDGDEARERLTDIVAHGRAETKIALARGIARRAALRFADTLVLLLQAPEPGVRRATVEAIGSLHDRRFIRPLIEALPAEATRTLAARALVAYGAEALAALDSVLGSPGSSRTLRWRIVQLIPSFEPERGSKLLLRLLPREDDGAVRFQIIRGLEGLVRRNPRLSFDRTVLDDAISATVRRAYRYVARRVALLAHAAEAAPAQATYEFLATVLLDKAKNATDRLFRLLDLVHPLEDFVLIYRGIVSGRRDARSSALELVSHELAEPLRGAVIGLVDELADEQRLRAGGAYAPSVARDFESLLADLLDSTSESVREATVELVGELGLAQFAPKLEALRLEESVTTTATLATAIALERFKGVSS
jgi:ATP:ADP antiporter, AAA family